MTDNAQIVKVDVSVPLDELPLLTVIVPVYNEVGTVFELLARVIESPYTKQVIVVDDGSRDGTTEVLLKWRDQAHFEFLRHESNLGRGAAIRTGLQHAQGRFTIVQDADLEYDPKDYPLLIEPLRAGKARVVFGSRYMAAQPDLAESVSQFTLVRNDAKTRQPEVGSQFGFAWNSLKSKSVGYQKAAMQPPRRRQDRWAVAALKLVVHLFYGARLTDVATGYMAFSTDLLRTLDLQCERFEFCPEVIAKLCRQREMILEVPIHYESRFVGAGKNRSWLDGLRALTTLWRSRNWWKGQKTNFALIVANGPKQGMEIPVSTSEFRIGRGNDCHVQLLGGSTADLHCHIAVASECATIVALKDRRYSRGTFVNDELIHRCRLRNYDRIRIASLEFDVRITAKDAFSEEAVICEGGDTKIAVGPVVDCEEIASIALEANIVSWIDEDVEVQSSGPKVLKGPYANRQASTIGGQYPAARKRQATGSDDIIEWRKLKLADVLLMLAIVNLAIILFMSCFSVLSVWQCYCGLLLSGLASVVTLRATRACQIKLDSLNQACSVLAILTVALMLPIAWYWREFALEVPAALCLLLSIGRVFTIAKRHLAGNMLDLLGILALLFAGIHLTSQAWRLRESCILVIVLTLFVVLKLIRMTERRIDNFLSLLVAISIVGFVDLAYLFPIATPRERLTWLDRWHLVISWRPDSWLWLQYKILPHWSEIWWCRWGLVALFVGLVSGTLLWQTRKT